MQRKDFTGQRFGKVVVISPSEKRNRGSVVWNCRCDCGKEFQEDARKLKTGLIQSCGCEPFPAEKYRNLTGLRFGSLTVLGKSGNRTKDRNPLWLCQCDCGKKIETTKHRLLSGGVSSCGCGHTPPLKDWIGKRFGRAEVIAYAGKKDGWHLWQCRCDCGNEFVARQSNLQHGQTTSCGCFHRERPSLHFVDGTFVERIASKKLPSSNTSGVRGVYFNKKRGKWVAQIMLRGKCYYLGAYSRIEDAAKARARGEEMFDDFLAKYAQTYPFVEAAQVDVPNDLQAPKLPDGMTDNHKTLGSDLDENK